MTPPEFKTPGVFVDELRTRPAIDGAPTSVTAFVGQTDSGPVDGPVVVRSFVEFERTFGGLSDTTLLGHAVHQFFTNGGMTGVVVRIAGGSDAVQNLSGDPRAMTGIHALAKHDDGFNLLCIPPIMVSPVPGGPRSQVADVPVSVWAAASVMCRERRAVLLADSPHTWDARLAAAGIGAFSVLERPNAALYFPWVRVADPLHPGATRDLPPAGAVAGVIARVDTTRGVWMSPAGAEASLSGVVGLSVNGQPATLTRRDTDTLNPLGVNCLSAMPNGNYVVWGARTLAGDAAQASEWKYVAVRRLALFIERSIDDGTQWAVFEPNGDALWIAVRVAIENFMMTLFGQGALQGRSPREAYFVRCDRTTMTQNDIDSGVLIGEVGFAPVKPAEFVIFQFRRLVQPA